MNNPIFGDEYGAIVETLIEARSQAGLSQRQLAQRLGRSQSHICMIEKRQRRVELVEFCKMAGAMHLAPEILFARVLERIRGTVDGAIAATPLRRVA